MKLSKPRAEDVKKAIETVKDLESGTGVRIRSGLRAGAGGGSGKGGVVQPLYGAPTSSE